MKLGLLTAAFPDLSLEQIAEWAALEGFDALEVACWPAAGAEGRRYAGVSHIDVTRFDPDEVLGLFDRHGLATAIAVIAREFPARLRKISAEQFQKMLKPIGDGEFNTLSSAYAVRALKAHSHAVAQNPPELSIAELHKDKSETRLINGMKALLRSELSGNASGLRFNSAQRLSGPGAFFQVVEAGFDRQVPNQALSNGLEVYREVLGRNNEAATRTKLGEQLHVRIHVRSLQREFLTNVAVVDLLPGGFEVVDSSIHTGAGATPGVDYVDVREDRAVFFVTAPTNTLEIDYQIKSCNRGQFIVPPVFAQSMYDRNVKSRGVGGKITVTE